jgi:deferrochelatase/peroxidase EfeB
MNPLTRRSRPLLHLLQRDPERQFVAIQRRLGSSDALNEYIKHVGNAVFAVPPGARRGGYAGETLLG